MNRSLMLAAAATLALGATAPVADFPAPYHAYNFATPSYPVGRQRSRSNRIKRSRAKEKMAAKSRRANRNK